MIEFLYKWSIEFEFELRNGVAPAIEFGFEFEFSIEFELRNGVAPAIEFEFEFSIEFGNGANNNFFIK